jgi:hypothetical protein
MVHSLSALLAGGLLLASPEAVPEQARSDAPARSAEERLTRLESQLEALEEENKALREDLRRAAIRKSPAPHLTLGEMRLRLAGYFDFGFFKASGDGVAYTLDAGKRLRPQYHDVPWVFLGDPWANPINSQGDSADLGLDRTNIARWDPIASGGRPSFLVNMLNLGLVGSLGQDFLFEARLNFEPRQGLLGSPGDFLDLDLAYVEWVPNQEWDLHLFVGKFEPTFGLEYRQRTAPDRFNITPSLIARYTVGTPTGVKVRGGLGEGRFTYNFALTNGGASTERFAHFYNELNRNFLPTASGRLSYRLPLPFFLEVGGSGLFGPQNGQRDDRVLAWQAGVDAKLVVGDLTMRAEWLQSVAGGGGLWEAPRLNAQGFYVDAAYQALTWLGAYARVDRRTALLFAETNLYDSDVARATLGLRVDLNFHVAAKVEYLKLLELGSPDIDNDVFTSSVVLRF